MDENSSYFAVFSYPVTLKIDLADLQKRFHELSKKVHPDKFTLKTPKEQSLATRWSAILNRAYQTLKDRQLRSKYILTLYNKDPTQNAKIPIELAESYFELQDLLTDGTSFEPLIKFKEHLLKLKESAHKDWLLLENEWGGGSSNLPASLAKLSDLLNFEHYLDSMLKDVKKRLGEK